MINTPLILNSQLARHPPSFNANQQLVPIVRTDPYFYFSKSQGKQIQGDAHVVGVHCAQDFSVNDEACDEQDQGKHH